MLSPEREVSENVLKASGNVDTIWAAPASSTCTPDEQNIAADGPTPQSQLQNDLTLFLEPLSNHSAEAKVASMRTAIEAGADVNQFDTYPIMHYGGGRPLDACISTGTVAKGSVADNIPAIELLLQHGADPRLRHRSLRITPLNTALRHSKNEGAEQATWASIVTLFGEAILRLDEDSSKSSASTMPEATR